MKRIALAVAVVVMAGACKKAQNSNTGAETRPDSMKMAADSMKMAPADTTHRMAADTAKAHMAPAPPPAHAPPPAPARRPTRRP